MKVVLVGAPGSDKSKVAKRAANILKRDGGQWKVIDGYVEKLTKRTGLPFGEMSTIPHNLAVITERWILEAEAQAQGLNTLTCGSLYESIIYSTFSTMFVSALEEQMVHDQLFNQVLMQALGALEGSTFDYDAIFWLPWTAKHADAEQDTWAAVVNAKLPEALDGFHKLAVPLLGSDKVRAERVVEVIRAIESVITSTPDDELTV